MTKLKFLVVCLVAVVAMGSRGIEATAEFTPKMLGEKLFTALKQEDVAAFRSYYITPDELKELFLLKAKQPFQMVDDADYVDHYRSNFELAGKRAYYRTRSQGEKMGIVWAKAVFDRAECPLVEGNAKVFRADIFVYFSSEGKQYKLKLNDCTQAIKRGWCMHDEIYIEQR